MQDAEGERMGIETAFARIDKELEETIRRIQQEWSADGFDISFRAASKVAARKLKGMKLRPNML